MGTDNGIYYGWEVKCYLSLEPTYGTASTTGGDYIQPAYMKALSWLSNDNVERFYGPGGSYRRGHTEETKGMKAVTAHMEFWMADDFGASGEEPFLSKLAIDKYNDAVSTSTWVFPEVGGTYPGDSAYGSYSLLPFTLEVGYNKTEAIRRRIITGCYVKTETVKAEMGEKVMWTWDIVGQDLNIAETAFVGSGSQATGAALDWSGCQITWTGEDDSATTHSGCEMIEWTVENNLEPDLDLTGTTQDRMVNGFTTSKRDITGTMRWKKKTDEGQRWHEILFSATKDKTTSDNTIQLGQFKLTIASSTSGCSLAYTLYDVILGELPEDIDFEKVSVVTLPFTSRYIGVSMVSVNTSSEPTRWDTQSA